MGRIINGISFENKDSKTDPFTEAMINRQEEQRLIRRIVEEVKKEITIDYILNKKSLNKVVDKATETIEKAFSKHGGAVSR